MDQVNAGVRRILVTGGSGYVGSVLVPVLARKWPVRVLETMAFGNPIEGTPNVEFLRGDILNARQRRMALVGCTDVVHLAGIVTDDLVDMNPEYARMVNIQATRALCQDAQDAGARRFIYASSSSVYGAHPQDCYEQSECHPMTAYSQSKLDAERIVLSSSIRSYDGRMGTADALRPIGISFATCAVRSATCCGPAPRMRLDTIVNIFSKQAYYDGVITVHGGTQWRSNIHVEDVARVYEALLEEPAYHIAGEVFNATCENHQAVTIAEIVRSIMGGRIVVDKSKQDNRDYRISADKLRLALHWKPTKSIDQAIMDNLAWFASHPDFDPNSDLYYNTRRMQGVMQGMKS